MLSYAFLTLTNQQLAIINFQKFHQGLFRLIMCNRMEEKIIDQTGIRT